MDFKKTTAGILGASALISGGIDASTLKEEQLQRVEILAEERVEVRQIEDVVEATFPWKDAAPIIVKYDMGAPSLAERIKDKRKREVITEVVDFTEGSMKIDVLLNEKPNTNRFCYLIEGAEQYDFFYQPPLTAEEIEQGAERPEEIEGSYAVYHKTLKNHQVGKENYATGKVMHIPRPQVWELNDEENTKEWAELSYEDGELCVTARQEFLDEATYPVRIDPTFGYTSIGASNQSFIQYFDAFFITAAAFSSDESISENGDVESMTFRVKTYSGDSYTARTGIFEGGNLSSAQAHQGGDATVSVSSTGWKTATFGSVVPVTTGTWRLYAKADRSTKSSGASTIGYDSGSTDQGGYASGGSDPLSGNMPTFIGETSFSFPEEYHASNNNRYSIYATYTASGGSDSCTYTSGDWNVLYSDNCHITSNVVVGGACNFIYDSAGSFSLNANITCSDVNGGAGFNISGGAGAHIYIVN